MAGTMLHTLLRLIFLFIVLCSSEDVEKGTEPSMLLTDKDWDQMLEGEWMVKFYAPWCPACRAMEEAWEEFAAWAANREGNAVKVGSVDVTTQPALNGRFMITALPTIYHVKNGEFRHYTLSRDFIDFKAFLNQDGWKKISPVSSWTSPTSFIMGTLSKLFSFSMELKNYHNTLNSDYGFPTWLSMLLFGLLIISVGLLLGMVLVLASDYIWGPPQYNYDNVVINKKDDDAVGNKDSDDVPLDDETSSTENDNKLDCEGKSEVDQDTESSLRQRKTKTGDDVEE